MLAGFSGCSLIYSGMMMDEHLPADVATVLAAIPVQESLPYPRHLNVRSGQLWQVQETIPGSRSENIYGLLLQSTHEEAITYQLLYHPAFWQAEAIYHELTQAWSFWKRTQQPIGAQAIQQLEKGLAALLEPHYQSTLLDQQRGELNHCLRVVQQHESTVYQLEEQIAAASQQYRILIKTFTTAKSGNLLNALQHNWQDHRKQLVITSNYLRALQVQVTNSLAYQYLLRLSPRHQTWLRLCWLTQGIAFVILCWCLWQQHRASHRV